MAIDTDGTLLGYAFCVDEDYTGSNNLQPIRTLYIDDICVDEAARGKHVGTTLYNHVLDHARAHGYHNVTLNAWAANPAAVKFYQIGAPMGMHIVDLPQQVHDGVDVGGLRAADGEACHASSIACGKTSGVERGLSR